MILETNASDHALVAILSTWSNGEIRPIAFHSRAFSAVEINYDMHDKELLVIIESFKKWWHYLEGVAILVVVYTDHKNLTYFSETKTLSWRLARWSEFLSQFNLSIKFLPGRLGKKPDALTWRWDVYRDDPSKDFPIQKPVFTRTQLTLSKYHDLAKQLSYYLYFFSFLFFSYWTYNYKIEHGKVSQMVTDGHVTGHRSQCVTWLE